MREKRNVRYLESRLKGGQLSIVSEVLIDSVPEMFRRLSVSLSTTSPKAAQRQTIGT